MTGATSITKRTSDSSIEGRGFAVVLASADRDRLARFAEAAFPEECCGVCLGRARPGGVLVELLFPGENVALRPRCRFEIAVGDLLLAHKIARACGLEVVGYYHSHPTSPPVPSEEDRRHAMIGSRHIILGPDEHGELVARSWILQGDNLFAEEAIELLPDHRLERPRNWSER